MLGCAPFQVQRRVATWHGAAEARAVTGGSFGGVARTIRRPAGARSPRRRRPGDRRRCDRAAATADADV